MGVFRQIKKRRPRNAVDTQSPRRKPSRLGLRAVWGAREGRRGPPRTVHFRDPSPESRAAHRVRIRGPKRRRMGPRHARRASIYRARPRQPRPRWKSFRESFAEVALEGGCWMGQEWEGVVCGGTLWIVDPGSGWGSQPRSQPRSHCGRPRIRFLKVFFFPGGGVLLQLRLRHSEQKWHLHRTIGMDCSAVKGPGSPGSARDCAEKQVVHGQDLKWGKCEKAHWGLSGCAECAQRRENEKEMEVEPLRKVPPKVRVSMVGNFCGNDVKNTSDPCAPCLGAKSERDCLCY